MKAWIGYGVLAVLAFGTFLVLQAPAALLLPQALKALPGTAAASTTNGVGQVSGTLFAGHARQLRLGARQLDQLRWRWQPSGLWRGRLSYRVRLLEPGLDVSAIVSVGLGAAFGWHGTRDIEALRGQLSLPRAIELTGRPAPPLGGRLELDIDLIRLPPPNGGLVPLLITGQVWLREAYTAFGRTLQLGDFRAEFGGGEANSNTNVAAAVKDLGGPTELDGQFALAANGSYRLSLRLSVRNGADPTANAELSQALGLLGQPGQDGRWRLNIAGRLGFLLGPAS